MDTTLLTIWEEAKLRIALILGAGFSCEAGLPSTTDIVQVFLNPPENSLLSPEVEKEISRLLRKFWMDVFNYKESGSRPTLEDHFTVLDLAANVGRNIGPEYTPKRLRAIRRLSIHRIFQILDTRYQQSKPIGKLLSTLHDKQLSVISTNWDIVVENHFRRKGIQYSYVLPVENLKGEKINSSGVPLLMLHGSANWIYCDSCRRLYAGESVNGKAALHALIYLKRDDFYELCPENQAVIAAVSNMLREAKICVHCKSRLSARIATFSYRKDIAIPQFQAVWQRAYEVLRDSSSWIFVGYSLPEADFEFRHLLKSAEKASSDNKHIRVVLKGDAIAGQRFERFFGLTTEKIWQEGLSSSVTDLISTLVPEQK